MVTDESILRNLQRRGDDSFIAGFIAIITMTLAIQFINWLGFAGPKFELLYGAIWNDRVQPELFGGLWWLGLATHLVLGATVFSTTSDYLLELFTRPTVSWLRGMAVGTVLWLFTEVVLKPIAGAGFFSQNMAQNVSVSILTLVAWWIYGMTYERLNRYDVTEEAKIIREKAA